MKTAFKWTIVLLAGLLMGPAAAHAQDETDEQFNQRVDPSSVFDFVDSHAFGNSMNITAVVTKDGQTLGDALVAVYAADGGIRGKDITDATQQNKVFLTVYGESSVPLVFKVYVGGKTYTVDQGLTFSTNAFIGMTEPYVISLTLRGDVNADGKVDVADAVAVANFLVGRRQGTFIESVADVNGDTNISIADAVAIVAIAMN